MKILWIEDFGGGLSGFHIASEIFGDFISKSDLNPEEELETYLPQYIKKNTLHELYLCTSYTAFRDTYLKEKGDFDIILIDVNLERNPTDIEDKPNGQKNNNKFDIKAGFYIYNQLIRKFPDDNIAFFTAEADSLSEFQEHCENALMELPRNTFQKKLEGFKNIRSWLAKKLNDDYLILRRGIIEGCSLLNGVISNTPDSNLEEQLLFYKTTSLNIKNNISLYRYEFFDYLNYLAEFFGVQEHSRPYHNHLIFLKYLVKNWEKSYGDFDRKKGRPQSQTLLEDYFLGVCQMIMKLLRNFSSHGLLTTELKHKDVAYFFMIAIRAWVRLDYNRVYKHEKILGSLFDKSELQFEEFEFVSTLEDQLLESYRELKREIQKGVKLNDRIDNQFVAMMDARGKTSNRYDEKGDTAELLKREVQDTSMSLFYNAFWHGLFPLYYEIDAYNKEVTRFNMEEDMEENTFPYFLGQLVLADSFTNKPRKGIATRLKYFPLD